MAPLIRADVKAAANWAEALHNVMAAAAIARVCWGPSKRMGWRGPISSSKGRSGVCAICMCWERQPDLSVKVRGGRSLLRSQPMEPWVAFQALEIWEVWDLVEGGNLSQRPGQR